MPITRRKRANPPEQPENNTNNHQAEQTENAAASLVPEKTSPEPEVGGVNTAPANEQVTTQPPASTPQVPATPVSNGTDHQQPPQTNIEGGRRTARGELFRRPPQPPAQVPPPVAQPVAAAPTPLQPPTHEISLPLGNLLHLAYNPGYTGSDEARSTLLHKLEEASKDGGRARCWNCGSIAIAYERWNTRSKTFGEVGVAFCEICGVWSVL